MTDWKIFAAIVLAVLTPVGGALLVYQVALWLSYDGAEVVLLLKGLACVFAVALAVIFAVVFCGSFRQGTASGSSKPKNSFEGRFKNGKDTNLRVLRRVGGEKQGEGR